MLSTVFAPIEPQTTTVGEGLRGHVENGWHKPTFQLRRYFSKVAALSIVKCEQAERPFGTPGQAARQILQVDESNQRRNTSRCRVFRSL